MKKIVDKIKNGKALAWIKDKAPDVLDLVGDITGVEALNKVADLVDKSGMSPEDKAEFLELYKLELQETTLYISDIQNARNREIEMAKTGKSDWMMYVVGFIGLIVFCVMVYATIWVTSIQENKLFIHLLGIVEGVVLSMFTYYFGTSKSSSDKNELLKSKQ